MKITIEHIAIWCRDLEAMRSFYTRVFSCEANEKYTNASGGFSSYFIRFADGARLELMHLPALAAPARETGATLPGLAHFALKLGDREAVVEMTERLRLEGCTILRGPRLTGDGYFETEALDIENNRVELVA